MIPVVPLDNWLNHHPSSQQILVEHQTRRQAVVDIKASRDQQQQPPAEQKPAFPFETGLTEKAFECPVRHGAQSYPKRIDLTRLLVSGTLSTQETRGFTRKSEVTTERGRRKAATSDAQPVNTKTGFNSSRCRPGVFVVSRLEPLRPGVENGLPTP
jgi:hypothetical protein